MLGKLRPRNSNFTAVGTVRTLYDQLVHIALYRVMSLPNESRGKNTSTNRTLALTLKYVLKTVPTERVGALTHNRIHKRLPTTAADKTLVDALTHILKTR